MYCIQQTERKSIERSFHLVWKIRIFGMVFYNTW